MMELIKISRNDKDVIVSKKDYIKAKWADLVVNFHSLTIDHVDKLVNGILDGQQFDGIIQAYIMDDNPRKVES